jgi:hypothetical protein
VPAGIVETVGALVVVDGGPSVGAVDTSASSADELPQAVTADSNAVTAIARRADRHWTSVDGWRM